MSELWNKTINSGREFKSKTGLAKTKLVNGVYITPNGSQISNVALARNNAAILDGGFPNKSSVPYRMQSIKCNHVNFCFMFLKIQA